MKTHNLVLLSAVLAIAVAGCKSAPKQKKFATLATTATTVAVTNELDPSLLKSSAELFKLGPGDRIEVEILGTPDSRAVCAVGPDGKIYYHLLPGTDVWGLTLAQTRELVERELGKFIEQPEVNVTVREVSSKHVWVLGSLNRPGVYPLTAPTSLLELIALAGGPSRSGNYVNTEELADLRHSFVMRRGQMLPVDFYRLLREGDTTQNIMLEPDDFIHIRSTLSQQVFVLGSVRVPGAFPYTENMTLLSAFTEASGHLRVEWFSTMAYRQIQPDAWLSQVAIVRGSLTKPEMAVVDLDAIIKGKATDVRLEPGDIVYVPNTPVNALKRYLNMVVNTFITTVAANEGAAAGGGQNVGVSVSVGQ